MKRLTGHLYLWVLGAIILGGAIGHYLPETGVAAQAAGRRLHRADQDADRADHLPHDRHRHRRRWRREEGRARGHQGHALLRGRLDHCAHHRSASWSTSSSPARASTSIRQPSMPAPSPATPSQASERSGVQFLLTSSRIHFSTPSPATAICCRSCWSRVLFGFALTGLGERGKPMLEFIAGFVAGVLPNDGHDHAPGADRRWRRDGLHDRQVWCRQPRSAGAV